ncbi:MAG: 50S ribosomal protein L33 [Candidatus Izemoplasma sp.]|nr:50S ribosomal protein L33 [Candidatus Izemoplasma sp.]
MRTQYTLKCTECGSENYRYDKNKRTHSSRMEMQKYCPKCNKKTLHREKK